MASSWNMGMFVVIVLLYAGLVARDIYIVAAIEYDVEHWMKYHSHFHNGKDLELFDEGLHGLKSVPSTNILHFAQQKGPKDGSKETKGDLDDRISEDSPLNQFSKGVKRWTQYC